MSSFALGQGNLKSCQESGEIYQNISAVMQNRRIIIIAIDDNAQDGADVSGSGVLV